ncbi:hypothetical protein Cantr_08079 [Candida viswanathii]|uniref:F-box domain-containing protein n=1 Tax=Candida viswanathii TaxID=5486 RepID=A0A367Y4M3_9ASCO|nr:hypothetical protein Cantr_08079 [Candida viswanathii]
MATFDDLPEEIIELIFSYLSNEELEELIDNSILVNHASRLLYSLVIIESSQTNPRYDIEPLKDTPNYFRSLSELIDLLKCNPYILPKRIRFENAVDALPLIDSCPEFLREVKVELRFRYRMTQRPEKVLARFVNAPFKIDSIKFGSVTGDARDIPSELAKYITSLSMEDTYFFVFEQRHHNKFPNLALLFISRDFPYEDLQALPKQLKSLSCVVQQAQAGEVQFDLPPGLELLQIRYHTNNAPEYVVDISQLGRLRNLWLSDDCDVHRKSHIWKVPACLKSLLMKSGRMVDSDLATTCPQLLELHFRENWFDIYEDIIPGYEPHDPNEYDGDFASSLKLPQTIRRLSIPSRLLPFVEVNTGSDTGSSEALKIPSSVVELNIDDTVSTVVVLDFEKNPLPNLSVLAFGKRIWVAIVGSFPKTLTKLTLQPYGPCGFTELKSLTQLTNLVIRNPFEDRDFTYDLPRSLKRLELLEWNFRKIHIKAPNLVSLNLDASDFKVLDNDRFIIPNSVRELSLIGSEISRIDVNFPPNLQLLDLESNKLTSTDNLPCTLRRLNCSCNLLGKGDGGGSVFPTGLEYLEISHNMLTTRWLARLNLSKCMNLKSLHMDQNKFTIFNTSYLPESLKLLSMESSAIDVFDNDFRRFKKFEVLSLRCNDLFRYFGPSGRLTGFLFGENTKRLFVGNFYAWEKPAEKIFSELRNRPNFELIDVFGNMVPELGIREEKEHEWEYSDEEITDTSDSDEERARKIQRLH